MLDLTDYELVWPTDIFVAEARRILSRPKPNQGHFDLLLQEAFRDGSAAADLSDAKPPWRGSENAHPRRWQDMAAELIDRAGEIRQFTTPSPYWNQRARGHAPSPALDSTAVRQGFADLVAQLEQAGYLAQLFPEPCVDDDGPETRHISTELDRRLGVTGVWPLQPDSWDDDLFYSLIEVYHDLVSRPRSRHFHQYSNCGWHYDSFATAPARELYRWHLNHLLQSAGAHYRIAAGGEDEGRLVEVYDDARTALIHQAPTHAEPDRALEIRHAIALFRSRSASVQDKRLAVVALAGILERRRPLIKENMQSKDEGALFQIANKFDLRHRDTSQHSHYDPVFLDWIFWWYLATIELTNRIIMREQDNNPQPGQT